MSDRVTDYALRSVAKYIEDHIVGLDAYIVTPDFDWDYKPNPLSPGDQKTPRPAPFAGISIVGDSDPAFSIGNILYEKNIDIWVHVCGQTYTDMIHMTADMKQSLRTSINPNNSNVGVPLYNFAIVSGISYAIEGTMQIDIGQTQYFGPSNPSQQSNRKHFSVTPVNLSMFKDSTATLLENKGRVDLTDS